MNPDDFVESISKSKITLSNFDLTNTEDGVEWIDFSELIEEDQKNNYEEIVGDDEEETIHSMLSIISGKRLIIK